MALSVASVLTEVLSAKDAAAMKRAFSMTTVADALAHYPRRYLDRGQQIPLDELPEGELAAIVAEVTSSRTRTTRTGKQILEVEVSDGTSTATITFFGASWRVRELRVGACGVFYGRVSSYQGRLQFAHPDYELHEAADGDLRDWFEQVLERPIPIYPATSTITSRMVQRMIASILDQLGSVPDPVPEPYRREHKLVPLARAYELIHRPQSETDWRVARHTLRTHEALVLQTALVQQREHIRSGAARARPLMHGGLRDAFDEKLPFALTPDQRTVGATIEADLAQATPMSRLVQGEVGSGKTLVAVRAMLQVADGGGQAALIAPTEVLAGQHLRSITKMLGPELSERVHPVLITGQMAAADRRRAALAAASGQALMIVGTHALLSDKTTFADLGLVVVDEQHRFGVEQRETLRAKGIAPHTLVLTATPIPRTVAMTVFGDLDVSTIRSMPAGRAGIETYVAPVGERPGWFARVWDRAAEEVAAGRQVFVVCAAIDAADGASGNDQPEAASDVSGPRWGVAQASELIGSHPRLAQMTCQTLTGQMPGDEKDRVMRDFAAGEIDILVATTVIEVGVDVPNASTMIVLEADRFGVSQLHQLRGRVGRGGVPGLCLLVTTAEPGTIARQRVEAVAATLDGFELADVDLTLRGEGDVLGRSQSGVRSSLRLLRVMKDAGVILAARAEAERLIADDPALDHHHALRAAIAERVSGGSRAAMTKS